MPNIEELRRYAVLDPDSDTTMLRLCMDAAVEWFKGAGVQPQDDNPLYNLGVYMLAVHYHDNRGAIAGKDVQQIPFGVFSIMHQLR